MVIKLFKIKTLDLYFFNIMKVLLAFMGLTSFISITLNWNISVLIPTLAIFFTPFIFISFPRFKRNVFSILLIYATFLYVYIPLTYISILNENYIFGWGLASLPYNQEYYMDNYVSNLYFLFICIFSAFLSLSIFPTKFCDLKSEEKLKHFGCVPIFILGLMSIFVLIDDILNILAAKASIEVSINESLIKFLFYEHAYLIIASLGLLTITNKNSNSLRSRKFLTILITLSFIAVGTFAGSKASWLMFFGFFFIISYSYIRSNSDSLILFPRVSLGIFIIIVAPIVYYVILFYRMSMTTSFEFNFFEVLETLNTSTISLLIEEVIYRLSAGGFDRFMLISTTFLSLDILSYGTQEYLPYIFKNFINLIMPGTIFVEAYAPSSQLFNDVIDTKSLDGEVTSSFLLKKINSQAYTIYGVITIITGWLAPIFIFLYNFIFCFLYTHIKHFIIRISLIYFYFISLSSFGFEVAAGYSVHIIISLFFMYYVLLILSKFNYKMTKSR